MHLGFEIKSLLVKKNIRQKELSAMLGIANSRVNQYLNGWYILPDKCAKKMCKIINIDFTEFNKGKIKEL
jgi:ribosome-binding protein aMBF1 (putative translation factor)